MKTTVTRPSLLKSSTVKKYASSNSKWVITVILVCPKLFKSREITVILDNGRFGSHSFLGFEVNVIETVIWMKVGGPGW